MTRSKAQVRYVVGDATDPEGDGPKIIAHACNDRGRWGKGFVMALSKRWPEPGRQFRAWHEGELPDAPPFELGRVQFVEVARQTWVANIIGQHGLTAKSGVSPVRYDALRAGLAEVAKFARNHKATVHMPRIGCGLAGGTWDQVGPIVEETLAETGVEVVVYDLPEKPRPRNRRSEKAEGRT